MPTALDVALSCASISVDLHVTSVDVDEAISALTRAVVHAVSDEDVDVEAPLGQPAHLIISADGQPVRHFQLVVASVRFDGMHREGRRRWVIELVHELGLLALRSDVRMFQDEDAQAIVAQVLDVAGVDGGHLAWSLQRTPWQRTYCVQYRESDLAFVSRLLEDEGIYYFAHDDDASTHVTFADASSAFVEIDGGAPVPLLDDRHGTGVYDYELTTRATPDQASVSDYNFETPLVDLLKSDVAASSPMSDCFEYPAGHTTPDQGQTLAKLRMEAMLAEGSVGEGRSNCTGFRAGAWFEMDGAPREGLGGKLLLTRVEHRFSVRLSDDQAGKYENRFTCIPYDVQYRPQRTTPKPRVQGAHPAVVTGPSGAEIHTDEHGRMKARFFWDRTDPTDDKSSCWMRVGQLPIGGSQALARVGWEMAVVYVDGDLDRPVGVARVYNAEKTSPYGYPKAQTRMALQTPSSPASGKSNELRMEDGGGGMELFANASKDYDINVNNDKGETIGVDEKLDVGVDCAVTIGSNQKISIGGSRKSSVSASEGVNVGGDRSKSVGGSETVTVGGNITVNVAGSDAETTGGSHTTLAAMGIDRTSSGSQTLTVGGSMVSAAAMGVSRSVLGAVSETVGGVKIALSGASVAETVIGAYACTVGGVCVQAAGGKRDGATKGVAAVTVGGLACANAAGKVMIKGKKVSILVAGVANFLGGGGILNLTPGSAAFVGLVTVDASGSIKISGNPNLVG